MDAEQRLRLIAQYKEGHAQVMAALQGVTEAQLDARTVSGQWTPREIVHHLADSETTSAIRLRRLLAEERPVLAGYDEEEFARRLYYDRPIDSSLAVLGAVRWASAEILDRLTEAEWAREGTHSESGRYNLEAWLEIYGAHAHDHAAQIRRALESAG